MSALPLSLKIADYATLCDDGAITFRYAERISQGKGFTYNDNEFINGASNPLHTLILAGCTFLVGDIDLAWKITAISFFLATISIAAILLLRYHGYFSLLLYVFLIAFTPFIPVNYFTGLEPGLTCLLISLLFLFLYSEKDIGTGISLGLLVVNKLDGGLAAIAIVMVYLFQKRSSLKKVALVALITATPLFLWLFFYFGTIVP